MFTWICPQCGREVLPSQSECPACADRVKAAAAAPPQPQAPPPQTAPQQNYAPPPQQYGPPPSKGLPQWLVMALVAGGMLGAGFVAYKYLLPSSRSAADETETVASEKPKAETKKGAEGKVHAYMKHLEVAGVRLSEDSRKRLVVKLSVINHSAADMSGLKLLVTLKTKGKGASTLSEVPVEVPNLGPLEAKEVTATVPTKLRAYELPDWQFLETSFEITAT